MYISSTQHATTATKHTHSRLK